MVEKKTITLPSKTQVFGKVYSDQKWKLNRKDVKLTVTNL